MVDPTPPPERHAAARELIEQHPELSDRAIGLRSGVDHKMVGRIRADTPHLPVADRLGRDGKRRPVDAVGLRLRIADLLQQQPEASLRAVAREVNASPETVRDVRGRLSRGEDPVPASLHHPRERAMPVPTSRPGRPVWTLDSACASTESTASFAGWFDSSQVDEWPSFVDGVPLSRVYDVADEARFRAEQWLAFAERLANRALVEGRAGSSR